MLALARHIQGASSDSPFAAIVTVICSTEKSFVRVFRRFSGLSNREMAPAPNDRNAGKLEGSNCRVCARFGLMGCGRITPVWSRSLDLSRSAQRGPHCRFPR